MNERSTVDRKGDFWQLLKTQINKQDVHVHIEQVYERRPSVFFRLFVHFLADRTNGRAIATLLRLSSVVVRDVMYCG